MSLNGKSIQAVQTSLKGMYLKKERKYISVVYRNAVQDRLSILLQACVSPNVSWQSTHFRLRLSNTLAVERQAPVLPETAFAVSGPALKFRSCKKTQTWSGKITSSLLIFANAFEAGASCKMGTAQQDQSKLLHKFSHLILHSEWNDQEALCHLEKWLENK